MSHLFPFCFESFLSNEIYNNHLIIHRKFPLVKISEKGVELSKILSEEEAKELIDALQNLQIEPKILSTSSQYATTQGMHSIYSQNSLVGTVALILKCEDHYSALSCFHVIREISKKCNARLNAQISCAYDEDEVSESTDAAVAFLSSKNLDSHIPIQLGFIKLDRDLVISTCDSLLQVNDPLLFIGAVSGVLNGGVIASFDCSFPLVDKRSVPIQKQQDKLRYFHEYSVELVIKDTYYLTNSVEIVWENTEENSLPKGGDSGGVYYLKTNLGSYVPVAMHCGFRMDGNIAKTYGLLFSQILEDYQEQEIFGVNLEQFFS